jgi:hypothetical protein
MFRWYEEAEICFGYLEDVPSGEDVTSTDLSFARSQWFTRGWTLQALLPPQRLEYLECSYIFLIRKIVELSLA